MQCDEWRRNGVPRAWAYVLNPEHGDALSKQPIGSWYIRLPRDITKDVPFTCPLPDSPFSFFCLKTGLAPLRFPTGLEESFQAFHHLRAVAFALGGGNLALQVLNRILAG